jgi:signal transduction histidine kinase
VNGRPPPRWTLTRRVVWAVTGTVALLMGLQTLLAYFAMHAQEDELADEMLRREAHQLIVLTRRPGLTPVGPIDTLPGVAAYLTRDGAGSESLPPTLRGLAPGLYHFTPEGRIWHVAVVDTEDGRVSVVFDATDSEARADRFGFTLLSLWVVCVAATALVARGVAAIAVGPIVEATRSIARWAPRRPGSAPEAGDEAAILMETFNRFRDGVDETVAREREFAADLEHEIRTPLTSIRTDAELLGLEPQPPAQQVRVARIVAAVDDIVASTEAALRASRGDRVEREPVEPAELVRATCEALADRANAAGLRLVEVVDPAARLDADRQALLTVCRNLVRNAIEHAAPGTLTIEGDARQLRFRDDGPGIPAPLLPHVFDRFLRGPRVDAAGTGIAETGAASEAGAPQRGLGLAIARRLCELQGWRLEVASPVAEGCGTAFTLALAPEAPSRNPHDPATVSRGASANVDR